MDFQQCRSLPTKPKPGVLYRHTSTGVCWLCLPDGQLLELSKLMDFLYGLIATPVVGPAGPQGPPGDFLDSAHLAERIAALEKNQTDLQRTVANIQLIPGPRGPRGEKGEAGRDGVNGKHGRDGIDGTPGKAGRDGIDGAQGPRGDVLYVGAGDIAAAAKRLRDERAAMQAKIQQAIDDTASLPHGPRRLVKGRLENLRGKL